MNLINIFQDILDNLKNANIKNYTLEVRVILQDVLNLTQEEFIANFKDIVLNKEDIININRIIDRRIRGEPLEYILGYSYFWKDKFFVSKDVLIPRSDSEVLIEALLDIYPNLDNSLNIIDIGVGSGCLLFSLLKEYQNAKGLGVDICPYALMVAKENQRELLLEERSKLLLSDIFSKVEQENRFDIIISNPPYIDIKDKYIVKEVKDYEPKKALFAKDDGLYFYNKIFSKCDKYLNINGIVVVEFGWKQFERVKDIAQNNNFILIKSYQDINKIIRCAIFKKYL